MRKNLDSLQKCVSENGEAVVYALDATQLVQDSMDRLDCWPPATKHLGQAMMAALLLQALNDSDVNESLSLQWMCEGPFGHLYAEARNFGEVRGTILRPQAPVDNYETGLGQGVLQVRRSQGAIGTTSLVNASGNVSSDLVEYLEKSEQKNCGINLSVQVEWEGEKQERFRVRSAFAYLIHVMPQPTEQKLNDALLRWDRQMQTLGPISGWTLRQEQTTLDMLRLITGEPEPKLAMTQRVIFACNCSSERALRALTLLEAQEEKEGTLQKAAETEIRCEYCGKTYTIKRESGDPASGEAPKPARKAPTAGKKKSTGRTGNRPGKKKP
jgi:molecular chaperone Hsp33